MTSANAPSALPARLMQWRDMLANINSVRASAEAPQFYIEHYARLDANLAASEFASS